MCRFDFKAKLISNGIILVGHSMGAEICMAIAAGYQRSAPESEGYGVCCTCTTSPLVLPTEMQDQQVHAYDSAESVKFTVTNILSSREMLTDEDILFMVEDSLAGSRPAKEACLLTE